MMTNRLLFAAAFSLAASSAYADQCGWVTADQAKLAETALKTAGEVVQWCELCTGDQPKLAKVESVKVVVADGQLKEVQLNGEAIDLAYVFVPHEKGAKTFDNLAKRAGCETSGVSMQVTWPPQAQSATDWSGSYERAGVTWRLAKPTAGPSYEIAVEFGDATSRARFAGNAEMKSERITFKLAISDCAMTIKRIGKQAIDVMPAGKGCAALNDTLPGRFAKATGP